MVDIDIFLQPGSFRTKQFLLLTLFSQYTSMYKMVPNEPASPGLQTSGLSNSLLALQEHTKTSLLK